MKKLILLSAVAVMALFSCKSNHIRTNAPATPTETFSASKELKMLDSTVIQYFWFSPSQDMRNQKNLKATYRYVGYTEYHEWTQKPVSIFPDAILVAKYNEPMRKTLARIYVKN